MLEPTPLERKFERLPRGFFFMMSFSPFSIPKAIAGKVSVTKLIHKICTGAKIDQLSMVIIKSVNTSPKLADKRYWIAFWMLEKTFLPSRTAKMIVAKLSSAKTISEAFLDTSVPVIPIPTPISAVFKAGASLTPSPVIATILPCACHALTIRTLCSGATRA